MLFGVGLATTAGLAGAIFYVVHHIVIQTTLFLAAGLIERRGGTTSLERLGGLARLAPLLGVLFFVPALNLAGIPPFSGFLGKLGLLQAGVRDGGVLAWLLVAGGVLTSLLTLYAVTRVWSLAFWRRPHADMPGVGESTDAPVRTRPGLPRLMVTSTLALVVLGTAITAVAGPLFAISADAAAQLRDRQPYVRAVFPDGTP
jgi:multicomponent Na+:H+ antiporter subunit D